MKNQREQNKECHNYKKKSNKYLTKDMKMLLHNFTSLLILCQIVTAGIAKRSYSDQSVRGYMAERTCWWNEVCKEEFQNLFRCKCPQFSFCRSAGRYYDAYCSVADTGYIWTQPTLDWVR